MCPERLRGGTYPYACSFPVVPREEKRRSAAAGSVTPLPWTRTVLWHAPFLRHAASPAYTFGATVVIFKRYINFILVFHSCPVLTSGRPHRSKSGNIGIYYITLLYRRSTTTILLSVLLGKSAKKNLYPRYDNIGTRSPRQSSSVFSSAAFFRVGRKNEKIPWKRTHRIQTRVIYNLYYLSVETIP